tara:strand:- start:225 stop:695 length:471 start_codon:yes stop_codon:yes gene_type:complete
MDLKQLYQDIILEHGKTPSNFGKCENCDHEAKGHNPLCGDQVQIYLKLDKKKNITDLSFEGTGCAISMASTSIMTELIKGKSFKTAKNIINTFLNMIKNTEKINFDDLEDDQRTKIMSLSGVKQYPMRVKCATLGWHTLISAMDGEKKEINTETLE